MTTALNYTSKAIADLPAYGPGGEFLADLLSRAEVFVLPESGALLERNKPRPEVPGMVFRPPFPVVALEYPSSKNHYASPFEQVDCTKRIALAWEWDGVMPGGPMRGKGPEIGSGVVVASIVWYDDAARWVPVCGALLIPYDLEYGEASSPLRDFMVKTGRISRAMAKSKGINAQSLLPIIPEVIGALMQQGGMQLAFDTISSDLMDEVNAYADLCIALSCNNVDKVRVSQPDKLNRARAKAGKLPLKDFHVLEVRGSTGHDGLPGIGGGVRSHLRRGHIRRIGPERITWVNACVVRGSRPGFVDKAYSVGAVG